MKKTTKKIEVNYEKARCTTLPGFYTEDKAYALSLYLNGGWLPSGIEILAEEKPGSGWTLTGVSSAYNTDFIRGAILKALLQHFEG